MMKKKVRSDFEDNYFGYVSEDTRELFFITMIFFSFECSETYFGSNFIKIKQNNIFHPKFSICDVRIIQNR